MEWDPVRNREVYYAAVFDILQSRALSRTINHSQVSMRTRTLFISVPCDTPAYVKSLMILPFFSGASGLKASTHHPCQMYTSVAGRVVKWVPAR